MVGATLYDTPTQSQTLSLTSTQNLKPTPQSTKTTPTAPPSTKPRSKQLSSIYLSPSPSASASTSTTAATTTTATTTATTSSYSNSNSRRYTNSAFSFGRSQSVERRRPAVSSVAQGSASDVSAELLITRRLSVSFQGEAFSLPISKGKKATPERRTPSRVRDQAENSKPDQHHHRWPARDRQGSSDSAFTGRLQQPMIEKSSRRTSFDGRLSFDSGKAALSTSLGQRTPSSKISQPKRLIIDNPSKPITSPLRGPIRSASPLRAKVSPSRARHSTVNSCGMPSIQSFSADIRRGKMGEDRIADAHLLRLVYNRYLQWRFVNARADAAFAVQRLTVENKLWNACVSISELLHSATLKRMNLLLLKQKLKRSSILKGQIAYLEEWFSMEKEYRISFHGATEALTATTLRLPVVGKATADLHQLKDAVCSSVDVLHSMASSICSLSSKVLISETKHVCILLQLQLSETQVEKMSWLVCEVGYVCSKEGVSLNQCTDFLSRLSALQVKESSLRTNILQWNQRG